MIGSPPTIAQSGCRNREWPPEVDRILLLQSGPTDWRLKGIDDSKSGEREGTKGEGRGRVGFNQDFEAIHDLQVAEIIERKFFIGKNGFSSPA